MNIVIPMAGAGQRFAEAGYKVSKPVIPVIDRRSGKEYPMVICATMDLPGLQAKGANLIYIDRTFHKDNGVEETIRNHYPEASFITVNSLTEGQACTCLLARDMIDNEQPLFIAGCDNGMVFDPVKFEALTRQCDVIAFTYSHDDSVLDNPDAYGWYIPDEEGKIQTVSIKKAVSDTPTNDHAVVASFWFRRGNIFVEAAEKMIRENDRINGEFYVDQVLKHALELGYDCRIFDIERYIGWGTPVDYENYMATVRYWRAFVTDKRFIPED